MKLKQLIPTKTCLDCRICCRFLDKNSRLAPIFLPHEIWPGIKHCLNKTHRVKLKFSRKLKIYTCPFFKIENNACSIYSKRPLDCRLYPLAIMFDKKHERIVLGIDTKCSFAVNPKNKNSIKGWAKQVVRFLEENRIAFFIPNEPSFIGTYQADVIQLSDLSSLTKLILNNPEKKGFKRLGLKDKVIFDNLLKGKMAQSSNTFVNLYIWKDINPIWWKKENGRIKFLLENDAGYIDFDSIKKFPDYIYLQKDLAELKGKKYRHKRAACNHFIKNYKFQYILYKKSMKNECLNLFSKWTEQRKQKFTDSYYRHLLDDSYFAHKTILENYKALGLIGRVIKIKGEIRAYTFGFELTKDMFCVLLEVCDLKFKGISEFIFREFCREMAHYKYINTMDDSGLENLRLSKLSYHPLPQQIFSKSH